MYQPSVPLIPLSPHLRARRLGEVELGRLLLLRDSPDPQGGPGIGVRADALSARGDLTEGLVRISGGPTRFERRTLEDAVIAMEIDYLVEADLPGVQLRLPQSGDLVVAANRPGAAMFIANLWPGAAGLLDLASAVIRPFGPTGRTSTQVALSWRLVEREQRTRVLFARPVPEPLMESLPRRAFAEESD